MNSRRVPWYDLRRARMRLLLAWAFGALASLLASQRFDARMSAIAGWDAAGFWLLASSWWIIVRGNAAETRRRAAAEDPGRRVLLVVVIVASVVGFFSAALLAHQTGDMGALREAAIALCLAAPVIAWLVTHSVYALHYAHLYYSGEGPRGEGLSFPGTEAPDDLDFAYFSFTVGMCFQVSDVAVTSQRIRRTLLTHSLLAFVFNTGVLALALNLALGSLL